MSEKQFSRRQALAFAGAAATALAFPWSRHAVAQSTQPAAAAKPVEERRFKIAGDDLFLNNNRQKIKSFKIAQKAGLDGIQLDMGGLPKDAATGKQSLKTTLRDPAVRQQFLDESKKTGVRIASMAWFAMYAHVYANMDIAVEVGHEWIETISQMGCQLGFMPLMTKDGTLAEPEHGEVWKKTVGVFKTIAPAAEKAGVVLGVESNLDGDGYKKFLDAVGSPAVRAFYNPGVGLGDYKYDVYADLKSLGKDRIAALHLEQGSVAPETFERRLGDGLINFPKLRDTLLDIGWGGWMSIARSRLKGTTSADTNMRANGDYVRSIFPE
ncbi:MAG: sugar phosphate isomerase/epimerase family protein [Tepidisphaeraceae bacterium]